MQLFLNLYRDWYIPLMSEYLYREHNKLEEAETKQDCEVTAAERLIERLKKYFPRQKFFIFADGNLC